MSKIVRLYSPDQEETIAPVCEQAGRLDALHPLIREEISKYRQTCAPYIEGNGIATLRTKKGADYDTTLYEPTDAEPFVMRKYPAEYTDQKLPGHFYSIGYMAFLIDRKVARVLGATPIGPQFNGASHISRRIITSVRPGERVTIAPEVSAIPTPHVRKFIESIIAMNDGGIVLDPNPNHVLYDPSEGFSVTNALPTVKLIAPPAETEMELARAQIEDINRGMPRENKLILKPTVEHSLVGDDLLIAARFLTYARLSNFTPPVSRKNSAQYGIDQILFQQVFFDNLYQLMGTVKTEFPKHFLECNSIVEDYLKALKLSANNTALTDPTVLSKISAIQALAA